jgi:hypothetical protein
MRRLLALLLFAIPLAAQTPRVNIVVQPAEWPEMLPTSAYSSTGCPAGITTCTLPTSYTRTNAPVTFGLVIPDSWQIDCPNLSGSAPAYGPSFNWPWNQEAPTELALYNGSTRLPMQARCEAAWPDGYAEYVLIDAQLSNGWSGGSNFTEGWGNFDNSVTVNQVTTGSGLGGNYPPSGAPANIMGLCSAVGAPSQCPSVNPGNYVYANTTASVLIFKTKGYNLFDDVTTGSAHLVADGNHAGTDGLTILGPTYNAGQSGTIDSVSCWPGLTGTSGPPPGSYVGTNVCNQIYSSANDTTSTGACTTFLQAGSCFQIEENGPLRGELMTQGDFNDGSGHVYMHWRTRTTCWYNHADCKVEIALRNADVPATLPTCVPACPNFTDASKHFQSFQARLTNNFTANTFVMANDTATPTTVSSFSGSKNAVLIEGFTEDMMWDHILGSDGHTCAVENDTCFVSPVPQLGGTFNARQWSLNGWQMLTPSGSTVVPFLAGSQTQYPVGWCDLNDSGTTGGIAFGSYQFAAYWPKGCEARPMNPSSPNAYNQIALDIYPDQTNWSQAGTVGGSTFQVNPAFTPLMTGTTCPSEATFSLPCQPIESYVMQWPQWKLTETHWNFYSGTACESATPSCQETFLFFQHKMLARPANGATHWNNAKDAISGSYAAFYPIPDPVANDHYYKQQFNGPGGGLFGNFCNGLTEGTCVGDVGTSNFITCPTTWAGTPSYPFGLYAGQHIFNFFDYWLGGGCDRTQQEENLHMTLQWETRGCAQDLTHYTCLGTPANGLGAGTAGSVPGRFIWSEHFYHMVTEKTMPHSDGTPTSGSSAGFRHLCTGVNCSGANTGESGFTNWGDPRPVNLTTTTSLWNAGMRMWGDDLDGQDHNTWNGYFTFAMLTGNLWMAETVQQGFKDRHQNMWATYNNIDTTSNSDAGHGQNNSTRQLGHGLSELAWFIDYLCMIRDVDCPNTTTGTSQSVYTSPNGNAFSAAEQWVSTTLLPLVSGGYPVGFKEAGVSSACPQNPNGNYCAQGISPLSGFFRPGAGGESTEASAVAAWKANGQYCSTCANGNGYNDTALCNIPSTSCTPPAGQGKSVPKQYSYIWIVANTTSPCTTGNTKPVFSALDPTGLNPTTPVGYGAGQQITDNLGTVSWTANTTYGKNFYILDSNGNFEATPNPSGSHTYTSGSTTPSWNVTVGGTTPDNGFNWTNTGPPCVWTNQGLAIGPSTGNANYYRALDNFQAGILANGLYDFWEESRKLLGPNWHIAVGQASGLTSQTNPCDGNTGYFFTGCSEIPGNNIIESEKGILDALYGIFYFENHVGCVQTSVSGFTTYGRAGGSGCTYTTTFDYSSANQTCPTFQPCYGGVPTPQNIGGCQAAGDCLASNSVIFGAPCGNECSGNEGWFAICGANAWTNSIADVAGVPFQFLATSQEQNQGTSQNLSMFETWYCDNQIINNGTAAVTAPTSAASFPLSGYPLTATKHFHVAAGTATGTPTDFSSGNGGSFLATGNGSVILTFDKPAGLCRVDLAQCPPFGAPNAQEFVIKYYTCKTGGGFLTVPGQNLFGNDCPNGGKQIVPDIGFNPVVTSPTSAGGGLTTLTSIEPGGYICPAGGTTGTANCAVVIGSTILNPATNEPWQWTTNLPDYGNGTTSALLSSQVPCNSGVNCSSPICPSNCSYTVNVVAGQYYAFDARAYVAAQPTLQPAGLQFYSASIGLTSTDSAKTLTLTNSSSASLTGVTVATTTNFVKSSDTCTGVTITVGGTCTFAISFTPTATGNLTGTATVSWTSAGGGNVSSTLAGTGLAGNQVCIIPPIYGAACNQTYPFDSSAVGTASADSPVSETLSNAFPTGLTAILCSTGLPDYTIGGTCSATLAADSTYQIPVTFNPTTTGARNDNLTVNYNGGSSTTAAGCSESQIQGSITSLGSAGGTVNVPSGSCSWSTQFAPTFSGPITLKGATTCTNAGTSSGACTDLTNITLNCTTSPCGTSGQAGQDNVVIAGTTATNTLSITGFTFIDDSLSTNGTIRFSGGSPHNAVTFAFYGNHMKANGGSTGGNFLKVADSYGFVGNNVWDETSGSGWEPPITVWGDGSTGGNSNWQDATGLGTNQAIFLEGNTYNAMHQNTEGFYDGYTGCKVVVRYNYVLNSGNMGTHGFDSTPESRSCVFNDINNNTFVNTSSSLNPLTVRGGVQLVWNNTYTGTWSGITLDYFRLHPTDSFGHKGVAGIGINWIPNSISTSGNWDYSSTNGLDWQASHSYTGPVTILPTSNNAGDFNYYSATSCTSGSSRPSFNQTQGNNTSDSGCTWLNIGGVAASGIVGAGWSSTNPDTLISGGTRYLDNNFNANNYPLRDQPCVGHGQVVTPCYEWSNTGNTEPFFAANSSTTTYLQSGRDFFNTTTMPGYTAYTYPYPSIGAGSVSAGLTGTGLANTMTIAPLSVNFGSGPIGVPVSTQQFVVTNNSATNATALSQSQSNPDFATSSGSGECSTTLPASGTCNLYVTCTPSTATVETATLTLTYSGPGGSPLSTNTNGLVCSGTATLAVTLLPSSLSYTVTVGGNQTQSATLTNVGTGAVTITSFALSDNTNYSQTNTCGTLPATLNVSSSCTINIEFDPPAAGTFPATLSVNDNAVGSPQQVSLTGTAIAPPTTPTISVRPH